MNLPRIARMPGGLAVTVAAAVLLAGCAVPVRTVRVQQAPGPYYQPAAPYVEYGTVDRIESVEQSAQPTGGGAVLGSVVGGVLGNQVGRGAGRAAATVFGVFGGAVLGNRIEQNQAAASYQSYYRVVVTFDNGSRRVFNYHDLAGLQVGERVRLQSGVLDRA